MRNTIIVGNWKMDYTPAEAVKDVEELSVKNQIITIVICKADTKELIINLRNENEQLKTEIENSNSCINELRDMVIAISMQ